jgi:capsular exopolysaccharide synthesis family protein
VPVPPERIHVLPLKAGQPARAGTGQVLTVQFILHAVRRWWKVAAPAGVLLATVAAVVVLLVFQRQYEAVALLEIQEQSPYVAFPSQDSHSQAYFNTQMDLIKSRWVLAPTIEQLSKDPERPLPREIAQEPDPVPWLSKRLKVVTQGNSNLFRIIYSGPDPEESAWVVNTVQQQYLKLRADTEVKRNTGLLGILAGEVLEREKNVGEMRERVRKLAKEMTGRDPFLARAEAEPAPRQPSAELQGRLVTTEVDVAILQARIKAAEAEAQDGATGKAAPPPGLSRVLHAVGLVENVKAAPPPGLSQQERALTSGMVERFIADSPETRQLEAAIAAKQARLEQGRAALTDAARKSGWFAQLEAEIAREQQAAADLREKMRPRVQREVEAALIARRVEAEAAAAARQADELARMRSDLAVRKILAERLKEEYDKEFKKTQTGNGSTVEYIFARDELTRAENVFAMIAQRQLALQTEQGAPARILLRHAAVSARAPIELYPFKGLGVAVLAGLCLPFALAVGWESLVRRVCDSQDLEQQSQLVVLGEIARLPVRPRIAGDAAQARIGEDLRIFEESIDSLRTTLTLSDELRGMRLLAVTSAANHEGKTSIAAQLAMSLARAAGAKTLLIDGDMRSPDIHNVFHVPLEPGLAEVLGGGCPLADAIVTSWSEWVHLLPAGKLKKNPHHLLGNGAWQALLAAIPSDYRYVIIDTPPVLAASESLVLAKAADASLVCAMRDVSRMDQVRKASQRLQAAGSRVIGTVLNGVPTRQYAYRYGTYAHSGG